MEQRFQNQIVMNLEADGNGTGGVGHGAQICDWHVLEAEGIEL